MDDRLIVLPEQFFTSRRGEHGPVRALMGAIFEDAIRAFWRHRFAKNRRGRRMFEEAERWLMRDDRDPDVPLRFRSVCDALDLDPEFIRSLLRRWEAGVKEPRISLRPAAAPPAASWRRSRPSRSARARSTPRTARASAS